MDSAVISYVRSTEAHLQSSISFLTPQSQASARSTASTRQNRTLEVDGRIGIDQSVTTLPKRAFRTWVVEALELHKDLDWAVSTGCDM